MSDPAVTSRVKAVFAKLAEKYPAPPPSPYPQFQVSGVRTHCITGVETDVVVTVEVRPSPSRPDQLWAFIVDGGVTGFESSEWLFMMTQVRAVDRGWCACAGTKGRWDRLVLDRRSLLAAFDSWEAGAAPAEAQ